MQSELGRLAASTALQRGDATRGLKLAHEAVAVDSTNFREQLWLGQMHEASKNPEEAEARMRMAIALAPSEPEPYVALVRFLTDRKQQEQALIVLKEMREKVNAKQRLLAEALCQEGLGEWKLAQEAYEQALEEQPDNVGIRRVYVSFRLKLGQLGEAEKLLRPLLQSDVAEVDRTWAKRALAILLADGTDFSRFQEALGLVDVQLDGNGSPIRPKDERDDIAENPEVLRAQARVLATQVQRQFRERALELFEKLQRTQNLTPEDQFVQALLLENTGNWGKAREKLEGIVLGRSPLPQYLVFLARGLIQQKAYDEAERWIDQLEKMEKERQVAVGTFASVELRVRLLEARGQGQKALELLKENCKRNSPQEALLLLTSLTNQRRYNEAFEMLDRVWELCRPERAGAASVSLLRQMQPNDEQVQKVETRLKQALEKEKRTVFRLQLADLYDLHGQYPQAIEQLSAVVGEEPNNAVALNNLAWLLANQSDGAEKAMSYIEKAIKGLGKRAELLDTRGIVYLSLGKPELALADLKEVNSDAPTASRMFHLSRAHLQARDQESALKVLRKARDLGLQPEKLHPIEQQTCQQMLTELKVN